MRRWAGLRPAFIDRAQEQSQATPEFAPAGDCSCTRSIGREATHRRIEQLQNITIYPDALRSFSVRFVPPV